jgi:hypothetical protein
MLKKCLISYSPVYKKKINVDPPSFFFIFLIRSFYKYLLHKTFILIVDKQYPV